MLVTRREELVPFTSEDGSLIREHVHTASQSLAESTLPPGTTTQRHYHRLAEEIYLIVAGSARVEVDGESAAVAPGDAILIPAGSWHELVAGPDGVRLLCTCVPAYSADDTFFD
jgi:quercetin dioxygenase-like cupin family protein